MHTSRHAPTWLFGITMIPFGVAGGFATVTMPFLVRQAGLSVESIGWYSTAALLPSVLQFLWAPIVDVGPKRRTWLVILTALGAVCLGGALLMPLPARTGAFLALTVAGQLITGLVASCNGGLLATTLPNELRGQAGGWLNAGNLGGGALGAWLTLALAERYSPLVVSLALGALMLIPALAAFAVPEADRVPQPARELFGVMWRDIWTTATSRAGWTGMLFCLSPVGTAALINFFSGIAVDYQATTRMVALVNGPVNGLVTAGGSLTGGYLCDRFNRRWAYLTAGGLTALCGLAMMAAPLTPTTYAVGVTTYLFISGLCYAAFSAVVLEVVGMAGHAAATQYTLFTAAGNFAIMYTGWLDTRYHHLYGPRGLLGVDALANIVGIALLVLMMVFMKRAQRPGWSSLA